MSIKEATKIFVVDQMILYIHKVKREVFRENKKDVRMGMPNIDKY